MIYEKLPPRLKMIKDMSLCYPLSRYKVQLEQYIVSHKSNIVGNTPEIIVDRLKIFFPEIETTLEEIVKL